MGAGACCLGPTRLPGSGGYGRLIQRCDLCPGAEVARLDHCDIRTPDVPAAYARCKSLGGSSMTSPSPAAPDRARTTWVSRCADLCTAAWRE